MRLTISREIDIKLGMKFIFVVGIVGLILIYLEFFVPGLIIGIIGAALILLSLALFFSKGPSFPLILFALSLVVLPILLICKLALWQLKRSKKKKSFYHGEDQEGFQASSFSKEFVGKTARAATDLKPSGHIIVEGQQIQALSQSKYIQKDDEVIIIGGQGGHVTVTTKEEK